MDYICEVIIHYTGYPSPSCVTFISEDVKYRCIGGSTTKPREVSELPLGLVVDFSKLHAR